MKPLLNKELKLAASPLSYLFLAGALILLIPAVPIFIKHWENFVHIYEGTEMRTSFIWNKEAELKRIGQWNEKTQEQLKRRG